MTSAICQAVHLLMSFTASPLRRGMNYKSGHVLLQRSRTYNSSCFPNQNFILTTFLYFCFHAKN